MDPAKYEIEIRTRIRPRVGFIYIISHPDRLGWKEESVDSFNSAEAAKKAAGIIIRRFVIRAADKARRATARL